MSGNAIVAAVGLFISLVSVGFTVYFNRGRFGKDAKRWIAIWDVVAKLFMVFRCAAVLAYAILADPRTPNVNISTLDIPYRVQNSSCTTKSRRN